jgi:hypothetical protein
MGDDRIILSSLENDSVFGASRQFIRLDVKLRQSFAAQLWLGRLGASLDRCLPAILTSSGGWQS